MAQKKETKRNIKKNRVAAIVAAILALGMILSTATFVGGPMLLEIFAKDRSNPPGSEWDLEAYREQFIADIENLEDYVAEFGPSVAVLENLAENYANLIMIEQTFYDEPDTVKGYQQKLLGAYRDLIDLEPEEPFYRLRLLAAYLEAEEDEAVVREEVEILTGMLHDNPDPVYSMQFIYLLQELQYEAEAREETTWLKEYLNARLSGDDTDNTERLYYAYLLAEYDADKEGALEQLGIILDEEEAESDLYKQAELYRDQLLAEDEGENGDNTADDGADE